jgi:hypothetical protein
MSILWFAAFSEYLEVIFKRLDGSYGVIGCICKNCKREVISIRLMPERIYSRKGRSGLLNETQARKSWDAFRASSAKNKILN